MRFIQQQLQMIMKKFIIIYGDSGKICQRRDMLPFLTELGMDELWWNELKDSVLRQIGRELIRKLMKWKHILPILVQLSLNSGFILIKMNRNVDSKNVRQLQEKNGKLPMRTGEIVRTEERRVGKERRGGRKERQ